MMRRVDVELQAAQFVAWHEKRGQPVEHDFEFWADSKDFDTADRIRIRTAVTEQLVATGAAVFTTITPERAS